MPKPNEDFRYDPTTNNWNKVYSKNNKNTNVPSTGITNAGDVAADIDDTIQELSSAIGTEEAAEQVEDSEVATDKDKKDKTSSVSGGGGSGTVSAEKQYKEIEYNTLSGEVSLIPTPKSLKIKLGDTITLKGLGKYLSGKYFVDRITYSLSASGGFSQSISVAKTGFGDNLKSSTVVKKVEESAPTQVKKEVQKEETPKVVTPATPTATPTTPTAPITQVHSPNTVVVVGNGGGGGSGPVFDFSQPRTEEVPVNVSGFNVGDKVRIVGDNATYAKGCDGQKVPDWVKEQDLIIDALSDNGTTARVNPIWSWTYTKYLKKI